MNKRILTSRKRCHILAVLFLMISIVTAQYASAQVKGEYFWNEDPGIGKATPTRATNTDGDWSTFDIAADRIPVGINILGLRAFSGGRWTNTVTYLVTVPSLPSVADWQVEYFWDNDPGIGKASPLDSSLDQDGGVMISDIPVDGLSTGEHLLGFRTCSGKTWSQTVTSIVFISDPRQYSITGAEYFWGKDPGFGKGTRIELAPGEEVNIENLEIDFPTEKSDEYVLSFRARSEKGWGLTHTTVIPYLYMEKIELTSDKDMLEPGETLAINAVLTPADAFESRLEWTSSNPEIATVANDGTVTGVAPGKVTITARATDGSEVTASIELTVMLSVKQVSISPSNLQLEVTREATLTAKVTPENSTDTGVIWSIIEGEEIVSLDDNGTVKGLKPGLAKIAATAADGYGAADTCIVKVIYLRGDANGDGMLAVNDVVLTARGVVKDIDQSLIFEAVDMNADNRLTVGDLTQVVDAVISYPASAHMIGHSRIRVSDESYGAAPLLLTQSGRDIWVAFDNDMRFTGVQFDVETEDGLTVESVTLDYGAGKSHSLANHRFESGVLRMLTYGTETFSADRVFATIHTDTMDERNHMLKVTNIMATDLQGNLYRLPDSEVSLDNATGIDRVGDDVLTISVEGHTLVISSSIDTNVMITDMKGIMTCVVAKAGVTRYTMPVDGIYIVNNQKIIIR